MLRNAIAFCLLVCCSLAAQTPVHRAVKYLNVEVPRWRAENGCFSCHNNGDGGRALFIAARARLPVNAAPLKETREWLGAPETWEKAEGDASFKDRKLAHIQFTAALTEAARGDAGGRSQALKLATERLAALQDADGAWQVDVESSAGSPVTYGTAVATYLARQSLMGADAKRFSATIAKSDSWFRKAAIRSVPDAAAIAMSSARADAVNYLLGSQGSTGGWGPQKNAPAEAYDTAIAALALSRKSSPEARRAAAKGRAYLVLTQLPEGGWTETTRPAGGRSYAQHISTTAWALIALLAHADK